MGKRLAGLLALTGLGIVSLLGCDKTGDAVILERNIPEGSKFVLTREVQGSDWDNSRIEVYDKEGKVIFHIKYWNEVPDKVEYIDSGKIYGLHNRKGVVVKER